MLRGAMRLIGHAQNQGDARRFGDYLYVEGITNEIERDTDQSWAIWVHDEDQLDRSKHLLAEFRADPKNPRFDAGAKAGELREREKEEDEAYKKKLVTRHHILQRWGGYQLGL